MCVNHRHMFGVFLFFFHFALAEIYVNNALIVVGKHQSINFYYENNGKTGKYNLMRLLLLSFHEWTKHTPELDIN